MLENVPGSARWTVLFAVLVGVLSPCSVAIGQTSAASLVEMRTRATAMKIKFVDDEPAGDVVRVAEPVLRYSAPSIGIHDATLWCFTHNGRPVCMFKVESRPTTFTCGVTSLSSERVEVRWDESRLFRTSKSGLTFKELPDAPESASTERGRTLQMKQITRRFSATFTFADEKEEMRLLPTPLYRYSQPDIGIIDGAVFGFVSTGTNPNAFLVVELPQTASGKLVWQYGAARLTIAAVSIRLDDKPVWDVPRARGRVVKSRRSLLNGTYASSPFLKEP